MRFSVSGDLNGRWETFSAETATEAVIRADQLQKLGIGPVFIKKNGRLLTDASEFRQLLREEAGGYDAR